MKEIIDQTRDLLSHQTTTLGKFIILLKRLYTKIVVLNLDVLFNYPSSVVTLSLLLLLQSNVSLNAFISEQMKSFVLHKKDASSYIVSLSY